MARFALTRPAGIGAALMTVGAGVLAWFPPERYGFYPRCPFFEATGWLCPGCGGTRALAALLQGNLGEAVRWNPLTVALVPLAFGYAVAMGWRAWRGEAGWVRVPAGIWAGLGVAAAVFGVVRNLG